MRDFFELTKSGIVVFVLLCGAFGFLLALPPKDPIPWLTFFISMLSLYLVSSGSCALNQIQEIELDRKMDRTKNRPLPSGRMSVRTAGWIAGILLVSGFGIALWFNYLVFFLLLLTVVLYNGFYTYIWKPKWVFGAVPGAVPGAMPILIGYAAISSELWRSEIIYGFLLMFLWQMPHYWSLAVRYRDDYMKAGFPVMPTRLSRDKALFIIGLYTFCYVGIAIVSPWLAPAGFGYLLLVLPLAAKILWEFVRFYRSDKGERWLPFFLWTTVSILVFLVVPVLDRWHVHTFGI
jgi:protoheme IX farnesyltransferase